MFSLNKSPNIPPPAEAAARLLATFLNITTLRLVLAALFAEGPHGDKYLNLTTLLKEVERQYENAGGLDGILRYREDFDGDVERRKRLKPLLEWKNEDANADARVWEGVVGEYLDRVLPSPSGDVNSPKSSQSGSSHSSGPNDSPPPAAEVTDRQHPLYRIPLLPRAGPPSLLDPLANGPHRFAINSKHWFLRGNFESEPVYSLCEAPVWRCKAKGIKFSDAKSVYLSVHEVYVRLATAAKQRTLDGMRVWLRKLERRQLYANIPVPGERLSVGVADAWGRELERVYQGGTYSPVLKQNGMTNVHPIAKARVPICKFHDPALRLDCDVNFGHELGVYNSKLIRTYTEIDPRVRPLLMLVKFWARRRDINNNAERTMSSYCYVLMVLNFLQLRGILPSLQALSRDMPRKVINVVPLRPLENESEDAKRKSVATTTYEGTPLTDSDSEDDLVDIRTIKGDVHPDDLTKGGMVRVDVTFLDDVRHPSLEAYTRVGKSIEKEGNVFGGTDGVASLLYGFFRYYGWTFKTKTDHIISVRTASVITGPHYQLRKWRGADPFAVDRNCAGGCQYVMHVVNEMRRATEGFYWCERGVVGVGEGVEGLFEKAERVVQIERGVEDRRREAEMFRGLCGGVMGGGAGTASRSELQLPAIPRGTGGKTRVQQERRILKRAMREGRLEEAIAWLSPLGRVVETKTVPVVKCVKASRPVSKPIWPRKEGVVVVPFEELRKRGWGGGGCNGAGGGVE
ncbi:hypothetical protein HDV00_008721 [Rhizophlyctis rosea]|nr:hypothetical protein HDV00_008721 [Rhizophlyctis rosea]